MYMRRSSWRLALKTRLSPSTNPRQRLFPPQWLQTCLVSPMKVSSALSRCLDYVSAGTAQLLSRFGRMFAMRAVAVALLVLASCAAPSAAPAYDWGMAASPEAHASEVGAAVLRDGGNA